VTDLPPIINEAKAHRPCRVADAHYEKLVRQMPVECMGPEARNILAYYYKGYQFLVLMVVKGRFTKIKPYWLEANRELLKFVLASPCECVTTERRGGATMRTICRRCHLIVANAALMEVGNDPYPIPEATVKSIDKYWERTPIKLRPAVWE